MFLLKNFLLIGKMFLCAVVFFVTAVIFAAGPVLGVETQSSRDQIGEFLKRFKFPVEYVQSDAGTPSIKTTLRGVETLLQLGDCDAEQVRCKDLAFIASFPGIPKPTIKQVVDANGVWPFVRLFQTSDENVLGAELDISLVAGDLGTRLSVGVDLWTEIVKALKRGLIIDSQRYKLRTKTRANLMTASYTAAGLLTRQSKDTPIKKWLFLVTADALDIWLKATGYTTFSASDTWQREMSFKAANLEMSVSPRICNKKLKHCGAVGFNYVYEMPKGVNRKSLNLWNEREWYVKAYHLDDKLVMLEMDLVVFDGMSKVDFDHYLAIWRGQIEGFDKFVTGKEADTAALAQNSTPAISVVEKTPGMPGSASDTPVFDIAACFIKYGQNEYPERNCGTMANQIIQSCVAAADQDNNEDKGAYNCIGLVANPCLDSAFVLSANVEGKKPAGDSQERKMSCLAAEYNAWMDLVQTDLKALDPHVDKIGVKYLKDITDTWKAYWTAMCRFVGTAYEGKGKVTAGSPAGSKLPPDMLLIFTAFE